MSNEELSKRLLALAADDSRRSNMARLTDVIEAIETVLSAGVRRSVVIDELAGYGLKMTYRSFDSALHKIRKKRGNQSSITVKSSDSNVLNVPVSRPGIKTIQPVINKPFSLPDSVELDDDEEPPLVVSHDPRDIDAIMRSTPDLEYYAKIAREARRKKKS